MQAGDRHITILRSIVPRKGFSEPEETFRLSARCGLQARRQRVRDLPAAEVGGGRCAWRRPTRWPRSHQPAPADAGARVMIAVLLPVLPLKATRMSSIPTSTI